MTTALINAAANVAGTLLSDFFPQSAGATTLNSFNPNPSRGMCTLSTQGGTLVFRTNPNSIWWSYTLNTNVEQTYGGRVVQILGVRIDDLVVKVDCGQGGWTYLQQVMTFMKDFMIAQRNGKPGTFEYTTRNWKMDVFAASVPFSDTVTATTRELELSFKVQEDTSGILSQLSISNELQALQNGVGWNTSQYNKADPNAVPNQSPAWVSAMSLPTNIIDMLPIQAASNLSNNVVQNVQTQANKFGIQVGGGKLKL